MTIKHRATRPRQLNLIYFVDSARTRSLQLSLRNVIAGLVVIGATFVWGIASAVLLGQTLLGKLGLQRKLAQAKSVILDYQIKYDGVYEIAYPDFNKTSEDVALEVEPDAKPKIVAVKPVAPVKPMPTKVIPEPTAKVPDVAPAPITAEVKPPPTTLSSTPTVIVELPAFAKEETALQLKVDIRNPDATSRAEGRVWAVATFQTETGDKMFVGAPDGIQLNQSGEAADHRRATKYSIQYHKPKNFKFTIPKDTRGKFTEVRIVTLDNSGQRYEFNFAVDSQSKG